jgi:hypothetical protein
MVPELLVAIGGKLNIPLIPGAWIRAVGTAYDAALGEGKDGWVVQAYGENLTDTRAELFANYSLGYKAVTVSRPRTVGLRTTYSFGGR